MKTDVHNLCIIPARGGSKRIPRKNIKLFLGKPIIFYSIKAAINSQLFDEVMVSTDDKEIADIAQKYGAKIPFLRSSKNADDHASTVDVMIEVLEDYKSKGKFFDYCCCTYPTAPLINIEDLKQGYNKLNQNSLDVVFPAVKYSYPIWRALKKEKNKFKMLWPKYQQFRSQDLEVAYHDAGQWYWFKTDQLIKTKSLFSDNISCLILDEIQVQDIDNETDWKLAELKYEHLQGLK